MPLNDFGSCGKANTTVWAQLELCPGDCERVTDFLCSTLGIRRSSVMRYFHLTVYHARRPLQGLDAVTESAAVWLPASETRFMVMAPGGENPRADLIPSRRKVGIRVHRQSVAMPEIQEYRERLLRFETDSVLGRRAPSTQRRNAFGARNFQPHMTLLLAGSGINSDLTEAGEKFRSEFDELLFDRFSVKIYQ